MLNEMFKKGLIIFLILMASQVFAVNLKLTEFPKLRNFPEAPPSPLSFDDTLPVPNCSEVMIRLKTYQKDILDNDQAQLSFIGDVANTAINWQTLLEPLEGQTATIPVGAFSPLKDYSEKINEVSTWAYDNSAYLAQELDKIIVGLENCKIEGN